MGHPDYFFADAKRAGHQRSEGIAYEMAISRQLPNRTAKPHLIRLIRPQPSLRRDADASNQVGETWIGTQRVPERFQSKIGETSEAFVVTLLEPHERLILVFQSGINQSEIKGRYKALFGNRLELLKRLKRLASLP